MAQTTNALFTPDSFSGPVTFTIDVPDDDTAWAAINFALSILADADTWLEVGTMTPEAVALVWLDVYLSWLDNF